MKSCFFVSPIGDENTPQRLRSDTVLEFIIEPVCEELGFKVTRVDKLYSVDRIDNTIYEYLTKADLVIADMSDHNPNVFYEMGFRHALGKPLIPIMVEGTKIPFDVANLRTITYVTNDLKKANEAKKRLKETIISFNIKEKDTEQESTEFFAEQAYTNVVPYLLNIQDSLAEIKSLIQERNHEIVAQTIDLVMGQIQKNTSSPEMKIAELFFSKAFENPNELEKIFRIAEKFQTKNNK
jgi:nucleoside 2-deoxyribosyltransferase